MMAATNKCWQTWLTLLEPWLLTAEEKKHLDKVAAIGCVLCHLQGTPGTPAE